MSRFEIRGTVPPFSGKAFLMPAENYQELSRFLREERITTTFSIRGNRPAIKIRGFFAGFCRPGTKVGQTIEVVRKKSNLRGIRAVSLTIYPPD